MIDISNLDLETLQTEFAKALKLLDIMYTEYEEAPAIYDSEDCDTHIGMDYKLSEEDELPIIEMLEHYMPRY